MSKAEVEELLQKLVSQDKETVLEAADALVKLGEPAVPLLIETFNSNDEAIRLRVAHILGRIGSSLAYEPMTHALSSDPVASVRSKCAWTLWGIGDKRAIVPLIHALKDGDEEVRAQVAWVLGAMEEAQAVEPLLGIVDDTEADVRRSVAWALGNLKNTKALDSLIKTLDDPEFKVRMAAREALPKIVHPNVELPVIQVLIETLLDERVNIYAGVYGAFVTVGDRAVQPLLDLLKHKNQDIRYRVSFALGKVGTPAIDPLLDWLQHGDRYMRREAAFTLGRIKNQRVVLPLISALSDNYSEVAAGAFISLKDLGKVATDHIVQLLRGREIKFSLRIKLLGVLVQADTTQEISLLTQALRYGDEYTRVLAAKKLALLEDKSSYNALAAALLDWNPVVRETAKRVLEKHGVFSALRKEEKVEEKKAPGEVLAKIKQHVLDFHQALSAGSAYRQPISEVEFLKRAEKQIAGYSQRVETDKDLELTLLGLPQSLVFDLKDVLLVMTWDYEFGYGSLFESWESLFQFTSYQFGWSYDPDQSKLNYRLDGESWHIKNVEPHNEVDGLVYSEVFYNLSNYLEQKGMHLYQVTTGDQSGMILLVPDMAVDKLRNYLITYDDFRVEWLYYGIPYWWKDVTQKQAVS